MTSPPSTHPDRHAAVTALLRLTERHAASDAARERAVSRAAPEPREVVRLVEVVGAGSATYLPGEDPLDADDLADALTLMPWVRAELDETELGLITMARGRGLTWIQVARGLGLTSAQAAQQRFDRLSRRVTEWAG